MSAAAEKSDTPAAPISTGQVAKNKRSYAGEKVTIASKLPMALQLQHCKPRTETRRERATTWEETVYHKTGPIVVINGTAFPNADIPEGMERPQMTAGFALTPNVDRDWWEEWLKQNEETPFVKAGLVFAHVKTDAVRVEARNRKDLNSNLGPIEHGKDKDGNPVITDKRMPKKLSARSIIRGSSAEPEPEMAG